MLQRKTIAIFAVVALIALAGCSGIIGDNEHTHDDLHEQNHSHSELHNHTEETGTPDVRHTYNYGTYPHAAGDTVFAELEIDGTVESFDAPAENVVVYYTWTVNGGEQSSTKYYVGNLEEGETQSFHIEEKFTQNSQADSNSGKIIIEGDNFETIEIDP